MNRCSWAKDDLSIQYHDEEWGVPVHDDRRWFEFLVLEGAQAGLSWDTILRKRENYRRAFAEFDPAVVARFTDSGSRSCSPIPALSGIASKVTSVVRNAQAFLKSSKKWAASTLISGHSSVVSRFKTTGGPPARCPPAPNIPMR